ncbi:MAG: hypothetical protein HKO59_06105 [Phycisphaerales bacterium]|nr:hypothetical protein [Phycisphaerae bacterium]NNF43375.1 hypothetical protein [Phycisphaerales bacterium]NNM25546.1 hypothetical protein [Phycisphaerales bacterium]
MSLNAQTEDAGGNAGVFFSFSRPIASAMQSAASIPVSVPRRRPQRRGGVTGTLLGTLAVVGTLTAAAIVVRPAYLQARDGLEPEPPVPARVERHQQVIELLGSLITRSHEVRAIHQPGASPYLEIVLWLEDGVNRDVVDREEIAVLAYSRIMQTVTLFTANPLEEDEVDDAPILRTSDMDEPAFCQRWRDRPDVAARRLATGVERMLVEPAGPGRDDRNLLRITLTWGSDSTDGPDEASVLLHIGGDSRDGKE